MILSSAFGAENSVHTAQKDLISYLSMISLIVCMVLSIVIIHC